MMMKHRKYLFAGLWMLGIGVLLTAGCRDPFTPEIEGFESLLVVEGRLTTDTAGSTILLSNSYGFDGDTLIPVTGATVRIEAEGGGDHRLTEIEPGEYQSNADQFMPVVGNRYRLVIQMAGGKRFESDFQEVRPTPDITSLDPIFFNRLNANGTETQAARFLLDTRSEGDEAAYFVWTYHETWEFYTPFQKRAYWEWDPEPIVRLLPFDEEVSHCWKNAPSTEIIIGNTRDLSRNEVIDFPVHQVDVKSDKVNWGYVLQVRQYAISEQEYTFLNTIRQNTETTGSIFDPIPGEVTGNIRCVDDPLLPVIGYFSASESKEAMSYIDRNFFPDSIRTSKPLDDCDLDTIFFDSGTTEDVLLSLRFKTERAGYSYLDTAFQILTPVGFKLTRKECADCKLTGSPIKPSFWPN